jgi:hypothetical protein
VTFPAHSGPLPLWGGTESRPGEIVLHGRGERLSTNVYDGAYPYYGYGGVAAGVAAGAAVVPQQPPRTITAITRSPISKLLVDRHTRWIRPAAPTPIECYFSMILAFS